MAELVHERQYYWYAASIPARAVNIVFSVIGFLLAVRLILVFFGANPSADVVAWLYGVTGALIAPFAGAFPSILVGGFVLETATILAMIGYAVVGWLLVRLIMAFA